MAESTCFLCSQRFNAPTRWCKACDSAPKDEFCPHFMPRIIMEEAAVQYFRTGTLPHDWPGIEMPEYYRIVDEESGRIEFDTLDEFYLFLKSTLIKYGINIDDITTLDKLTEIERAYFDEIESAIIDRRKMNMPSDLDDAYIHAQSVRDQDEAERLLKIIFERDRKGFKVIS